MPGLCARCHREVYFAEERLALGKVWHTFCFSCFNCRKLLDSCTVSTHSGELFCRNCYSRLFPSILRPSKEIKVSKEIEPFPRVSSEPTSICFNEFNCHHCRCCYAEDYPLNKKLSINCKHNRSEKQRLRGGGETKENTSTEGLNKNSINIPPRPCPRLSVRRVSFREERNILDRYRDMQNDHETFLAERKTSRTIENSSNVDILTIHSSENVRKSEQDLQDEELSNYSETVSITQNSRHDNTIVVAERNEDDVVDDDMLNYDQNNLQDLSIHSDNNNDENEEDRMRGGHGGNNPCSSRNVESYCTNRSSANEDCGCCSHQNSENTGCNYRNIEARKRFSTTESCSSRDLDPCQDVDLKSTSCRSAACTPPCTDRRSCCPPAGFRPTCRKTRRNCCSPCKGETQSCGGGGCCGSGCRGGCGKPGQICMPARPCSTPPCRPHSPFVGLPCASARNCPPSTVCCRPGSRGGCCVGGGGSTYCRSASPTCRTLHSGGCCCDDRTCCDTDEADSCCKSKVPPGCECFGGGLDCQRCGEKVYHAEMQIVSGIPYHSICFSCFCCRKPLESLTYQENCGEIYCKQCYIRNFGPQGYGYGVGAGALQTPM